MKKFSRYFLNLILLISLICKCSLGSTDILEETTNLNEESDEITFEDSTKDYFETQTENDELFKETLEQGTTNSIIISSQEQTREETKSSNDQANTNPSTKIGETTNKIMTGVSDHTKTSEANGTVEEGSSPFLSSNEHRETSNSVPLTTQAAGTSSLSVKSSLLIAETSSLSTTLKVDKIPASSFNKRIEMNGIVRNRRLQTVKRVLIQLDRILFIEDVNITNIEQALLKSIGYESIFNVTNEGNDEYSIGFTTDINTSANSALSLDDTVLKIVQNLKRDESLIQAEANKVGFDLSIDTSKTVIYATETLVINGITYIIICKKPLDQVLMDCQQGTVENGTISIESTNEVDLGSFASSSNISKFLLFFVTIIFSFQISY
ncbi:hypothetical protein BpHYR1_024413 [Brachionus plicatilis]|uniref:SEA domain-containing protein n=1 Tax=Brachionus plicatilis TaxID=10195 RepID=A0A3M7S658_BRAPC|nr:hypothetical protein BpHYR1_024413 [Brachionus plicatilis]